MYTLHNVQIRINMFIASSICHFFLIKIFNIRSATFFNCKWERESLLSGSDSLHVGNLGRAKPYGRNLHAESANKATCEMGRQEGERAWGPQVQVLVSSCCRGSAASPLHPVAGLCWTLLSNICLFLSDLLSLASKSPSSYDDLFLPKELNALPFVK